MTWRRLAAIARRLLAPCCCLALIAGCASDEAMEAAGERAAFCLGAGFPYAHFLAEASERSEPHSPSAGEFARRVFPGIYDDRFVRGAPPALEREARTVVKGAHDAQDARISGQAFDRYVEAFVHLVPAGMLLC